MAENQVKERKSIINQSLENLDLSMLNTSAIDPWDNATIDYMIIKASEKKYDTMFDQTMKEKYGDSYDPVAVEKNKGVFDERLLKKDEQKSEGPDYLSIGDPTIDPQNDALDNVINTTKTELLAAVGLAMKPFQVMEKMTLSPLAKKDYESESFLGKAAEAGLESIRAGWKEAKRHPLSEGEEDPAKKIVEQDFGNVPDWAKPAIETALEMAADPTLVALPFRKAIWKGAQAAAKMSVGKKVKDVESSFVGPFKKVLNEYFNPVSMEQDDFYYEMNKLANEADRGNRQAAKQFVDNWTADVEQKIVKSAEQKLDDVVNPQKTGNTVELRPVTEEEAFEFVNKEVMVGDKAININFRNLQSPEDINETITKIADLKKSDMVTAQGKQTWEETRRLANEKLSDEMGLTVEVLQRTKGGLLTPEDALAARSLLVTSAENLKSMSKKISEGLATKVDMYEFRKMINLHTAIQYQVTGLAGDAGRVLNAFKIAAASSAEQLRGIDDILKNMPISVETLAKKINTLDSAKGLNKYARTIANGGTREMLFEGWINGLLSSPLTHMVNITGNSMNLLWQIPERALSTFFGGGKNIPFGETRELMYGLLEGMKDGFIAFGKVLKSGEGLEEATKLELTRNKSSIAEGIRRSSRRKFKEGGRLYKLGAWTGDVIEWLMPGRWLQSEDAFFKAIAYRMQLRALSYRTARQEGLKGYEFTKRMVEIMDNPKLYAPHVHVEADHFKNYVTFTNELERGGQSIQNFQRNFPGAKIIIPFVRTPVNIVKYAGQRTPLNKKFWKTLTKNNAEGNVEKAKVAFGTMVMTTTALAALEGRITGGGPVDPGMRQLMYAKGWQPYSIKVGDKYYSYERIEPFGILLGTIADAVEIGKNNESIIENEKLVDAIGAALFRNLTSKTWLKGVMDTTTMIHDPGRYFKPWAQDILASVIPAGLGQINRTFFTEGELKEIRGYFDKMRSKIPGWSDTIPGKRNIFGEKIILEGGLGWDFVSPIYTSTERDDPVIDGMMEVGYTPTMPSDKQSFNMTGEPYGNIEIQLTPQQYDRFMVLMNETELKTGLNLKDTLRYEMNTLDFKQAHPDRQKEILSRIFADAKEKARIELYQEDGELYDRYWELKDEKMRNRYR